MMKKKRIMDALAIKTRKENRRFGISMGLILVVVAFIYLSKDSFYMVLLVSGMMFLILAFLKPSLLTYPRAAWQSFGHKLGIVNTYILLTLIYLLLFVPIGLLLKLFRRDLIKIRIRRVSTSYWEQKQNDDKSSMQYQF